jgi:hypothetical protein
MTEVVKLKDSGGPEPSPRAAFPEAFAPSVPRDERAACLELDPEATAHLVASASDTRPVSGLTHNHYKYPARFSPLFVRAAIETFSAPGDLIFDPFVGGGTTVVEALARGRDVVGVDISSLAIFVTEAKALRLSDADILAFERWANGIEGVINIHAPSADAAEWDNAGYFRNIGGKSFWRLQKAIGQVLAALHNLPVDAETLARCSVLRASHWAFDARKRPPRLGEFKRNLVLNAKAMLEDARSFGAAFQAAATAIGREPKMLCLERSAAGLELDPRMTDWRAPRLVLTSPPYPGVHVLYHRWQVDGRKETPAPFWIANRLDGSGESYYTLGHRKNPGLKTYFDNLKATLASTAALADDDTVFVQVVAFGSPDWQLPRYLEAARAAGLSERILPGLDTPDGRLWRRVPGRRWYADQRGAIAAAHEVVLFFRLTESAG